MTRIGVPEGLEFAFSVLMQSKIPDGFKVAYEGKSAVGSIIEMIPEDQSLNQWTEMLTIQILPNTKRWTLPAFYEGMKERWTQMCPCGSTELLESGYEQNQPTLIWSHVCPLNKDTGKPENTWFKLLIRGGDLIVAQKAFRFEPSPHAIAFWIAFLKDLRVSPWH